jgi:hypothetical protein
MISEKTFIRYYSSFWEQLLPGIDNYVRMVNSGLKERLYTPITIEDIPTRRALINGIAFKLFYMCHNNKLSFANLQSLEINSIIIKDLHMSVKSDMSSLDNSDNFKDDIIPNEFTILKELTNRLYNFFFLKSEVIIYPKFSGCGLLFDCSGDAFYKDYLVEIKAGNANISKQDFFQMFTYGALNYAASDPYQINNFKLLNTRTGVLWSENVETVFEITGGTSSADIYSEIINYISNNYRSI